MGEEKTENISIKLAIFARLSFASRTFQYAKDERESRRKDWIRITFPESTKEIVSNVTDRREINSANKLFWSKTLFSLFLAYHSFYSTEIIRPLRLSGRIKHTTSAHRSMLHGLMNTLELTCTLHHTFYFGCCSCISCHASHSSCSTVCFLVLWNMHRRSDRSFLTNAVRNRSVQTTRIAQLSC